jgi:D-alanyl-D-alanine endopeptidase (penicillin-binding protein 7)
MNADPRAPTSLFWFWSWVQSNMMKLVLAWSVCVVFFSARLTIGLAWVARIAGPNQSSANPYWQGQLNQLTQRCGMQKKVILRVVNNLDSPAVAGWLRPVILVPGTLITGMPPELLEALLAHEVAHIRRMDYSINLLQSGVEILLFYHPAVWWISKQIRIEREQIADDLAAQIIGEPRRLALALSELERVQFAGNQLALAANGGNLVKRIKRLTQPGIQPAGFKAIAPLITIIFAGIAFYANAATDTNTPPVVQVKSTKAIVDLRTCAKPNYPAQSLVNKDQGTVRMSFSIDLTGHVTSSTVEQTSGHPELDEAAIVALNKCSFTPGTINGKAVVSATNVDYIWKLPN